MNRLAIIALILGGCSSMPLFVATDTRVPFADAESACREMGGHLADLRDVDAVLDACRDSLDSGPCWVALSSAEANYAITLDGHLWAVPIDSAGEALAICEVR